MPDKPRRPALHRSLKWWVEAAGFRLGTAFFGLLPVDWASALGGALGRLIGPRLAVTRRADDNLRLAWPDMEPAERRRIIRAMWANLGRVAAEYPHLGRITAPEAGRVEVVNPAAVYALRDQGQAGILASAHLGNWEILPVTAAQNGIELAGFVREPNNPLVRGQLDRLRGVAGGQRIAKGAAGAKEAFGLLRQQRMLGILFDQKLNHGLPIELFGHEAMTGPALAQMALRFRCPVIPVRVERLRGARFRMTCYPALSLPDSGDRQADARAVMTQLNGILEGWIRARPEDWLWLHRRWPEAAYKSLRG